MAKKTETSEYQLLDHLSPLEIGLDYSFKWKRSEIKLFYEKTHDFYRREEYSNKKLHTTCYMINQDLENFLSMMRNSEESLKIYQI